MVVLKPADLGFRKAGSEIRIFARSFRNSSPAGISGHIDHRRKVPCHAGSSGFFRCHSCGLLHEFGVEGSGLRDSDRVDGTETVNDIQTEDQRNAQAAFLDCDLLQFVHLHGILHHQRAHLAAADLFFMKILRGGAHDAAEFFLGNSTVRHHLDQFLERYVKSPHDGRRDLVHLSDLLFQGHLGEDLFYSCFLFSC